MQVTAPSCYPSLAICRPHSPWESIWINTCVDKYVDPPGIYPWRYRLGSIVAPTLVAVVPRRANIPFSRLAIPKAA